MGVLYMIFYEKGRSRKRRRRMEGVFIQCPMPPLITERVPFDYIGDRKDRNECREIRISDPIKGADVLGRREPHVEIDGI